MRSKYQTPKTFTEWQEWASAIRALADRVDRAAQDRGWAIAAEVGIPRCGCCLNNASINDSLSGWCSRNPEMLKAAKRARRLVDSWNGSRIADRVIGRIDTRTLPLV